MPSSELVQSLQRGLKLLKIVSEHPEGVSLHELAAAANLHKTTAYNLLRTLCAENLLLKDQQKRFHIGSEVYALAAAEHQSELMAKASASLFELHKLLPSDVLVFATWQNNLAQIKLRCSPDIPGKVQKTANLSFPPYLTVTSLALQTVNQHCAAALEQQYPFEEFGECFWGTLHNFNHALSETAQAGFCCRQNKERYSAAFIMPDKFVLGFSGIGELKKEFPRRENLARRFKNEVWG